MNDSSSVTRAYGQRACVRYEHRVRVTRLILRVTDVASTCRRKSRERAERARKSVQYIHRRSEISIIIWPPNINISYLRVHPRSPSRIVEALFSKERQVVEKYILKILRVLGKRMVRRMQKERCGTTGTSDGSLNL